MKPDYFEKIRQASSERWNQLENDPELAGPWHQLFKQVQSPRHVLSELLQNADDANATEATVKIADNVFVFSHNGDDFIEEHFRSLCRFGYSNKRALHTIGFRGVGFKSVFSLGDGVELFTPSLSVRFFRKRFTEPHWLESDKRINKTEVRVRIEDEHRKKEIEKNLNEWKKSPVSLLFFRSIRRLVISETDISWTSYGPGPVSSSEWMSLKGKDEKYLLVRSDEEAFPQDSLNEIAQERLLSDHSDADFPPSKVELVLGAKGRLFVVLPTGVETQLPFAVNAPFIQDPARLKIKDPETSPTNRWLLKRVGRLAAETLIAWLQNESLLVQERTEAYRLFPDVDRNNESLEGTCGTDVELAFEEAIRDKEILLTEEGRLTKSKGAIVVPELLAEVWSSRQSAEVFDKQKRPPLSQYVSSQSVKKLSNWNLVESIILDAVASILEDEHLPKPDSWRQLLKLWLFVSPKVDRRSWVQNRQFRIFPTKGSDVLYSSDELVRLSSKSALRSDADWQFLSKYLLVLDHGWLRFIEERRRQKTDDVVKAFDVLNAYSLSQENDLDDVIEQVASTLFNGEQIQLEDCIRLAHIAAALDVTVGESFRFVTSDLTLVESVLVDPAGALDSIVDSEWLKTNSLHPDYFKEFTSCTRNEWNNWIRSNKSGLSQMVPLISSVRSIYGRERVSGEIRRRGAQKPSYFPYVTHDFLIKDWDFEEQHWTFWSELSETDPDVWCKVTSQLLAVPNEFWEEGASASFSQVSTTGSRQGLYVDTNPAPSWILRLRELPCLPDTHGKARKPNELLRRTPETEALLDVEAFIDKHLDNEKNEPLLELLGVGTTPTGPTKILDYLRSLATSQTPPISEVEKWYNRLDLLFDHCSTADAEQIRNAFSNESIILTENGVWETSAGVFLNADEIAAPGSELIRTSVRNLMLWTKVGVAERPSAELAINWLRSLPSGRPLTKEETRRVQNLLSAHSARIWEECGHWMNLNSEWIPTASLSYYVSMQSLVKYSHLFPTIKYKTADFQKLLSDVVSSAPFNGLGRLAEVIEKRFHKTANHNGKCEEKPWLSQLGKDIARIKMESEAEQTRIRELGRRLVKTKWQTEKKIQIVPYIDGVPAGEAVEEDAAWIDDVIYVKDLPIGKIAKAVSAEISKAFRIPELEDAIKLCLERTAKFVSEYMEENFDLDRAVELDGPSTPDRNHRSPSEEIEGNGSPFAGDDAESGLIDYEDEYDGEDEDDEAYYGDENYDDEDGDDDDLEDEDNTSPRIRPKRPAQRSVIDRFAEQLGYRKDSDDRYFHSDGSWIAKNKDGIGFQWERHLKNGSVTKYYFVKDHCLERKPLEIDTSVFEMLRNYPDLYSLVLVKLEGIPVEITGERVEELRREGVLALHPATYRIVMNG